MRWAADHHTVTRTFYWCKSGLGWCFELLLCVATQLAVAGCQSIKSTFCRMVQSDWEMDSQSEIQLMLHRIREDTSNWRFFWLLVGSRRHPLIELFHLPICFNAARSEQSTLSSSATSRTVISGSIRWWLSISRVNFWWLATMLFNLQASCFLFRTSELPLHCTFVSSAWSKSTVKLSAVSWLQMTIWTRIRNHSNLLFV